MNNIHGFQLLEKRELHDIKSLAYVFEHIQTKAKLIKLQNEDDNKVFCIGFRTPPKDSTGVCHIIEHTVLNGSKKYKTREPFMDMLKSSLQTFLNAMTYPDKTIYPIASRNTKDFHNLMDVYLDAVFYPKIYQEKNIFYQEGWHYHLDEKDRLSYNGVVYNEMRGSFSSVDSQEYNYFQSLLYPDTCYANCSGGDPYVIPELTYEDFIDYHKEFYSPTNSYIFLYGDGELEDELSHINDYLKDFSYRKVDSEITPQKPFINRQTHHVTYSIAKDEKAENKDVLMYGVNVGNKDDIRSYYTSQLLSRVLFSDDSAIIKNKLIEEGLGEDISDMTIDGLEIGMGIVAENTKKEKLDHFYEIIENTLKEIVQDGLNKEALLSVINSFEYSLREGSDFPTKGIIYGINMLDSWLYDKDPFVYLEYNDHLKFLRDAVDTNYYTTFIQEKILDNPHKILVSMEAVPGLNDEKDAEISAKLERYRKSLTPEEIDELRELNRNLQAFQSRIDTPEEKDTIPKLSLEDIPTTLKDIESHVEKSNEWTVLKQPYNTSGIDYFTMYFDLKFLKEEDLPYVALLGELLCLLDTENYSYKELSTQIKLVTAGISTSCQVTNIGNDNYRLYFNVSTKSMHHLTKNISEILSEVLLKTRFDNRKRIHELLKMMKSRLRSLIISSGHFFAISQVHAMLQEEGAYSERLRGISFYRFIEDLDDRFDEKIGNCIERLQDLQHKIFNRNNMLLSVTSAPEDMDTSLSSIETFLAMLPNNKIEEQKNTCSLVTKTKAFKTSSNVNYNIIGGTIDLPYRGRVAVLNNLLTNTYLYSEIRAKGGAYGQGFGLSRYGFFYMMSYRDPKLTETYATYRHVGEALRQLELSKEELAALKIGVISQFDPVFTPQTITTTAINRYLQSRSKKEIENELKDALSCTLDDLKAYADPIDQAVQENFICTVGNSQQIDNVRSFFDEVESVQ